MGLAGTNLKLEAYRVRASPAEAAAIDYVLEHREEAAGLSVQELGRRTSTSASTIVRLCRKAGFSGYREFQQGLMFDAAALRTYERTAMGPVEEGDDARAIVAKVSNHELRALEATAHALDPADVEAAADLLEGARRIALFGVGASLLVAKDLQLKLLRADRDCRCLDDWHAQELCATNLGPADAAVAFSHSGRTPEPVACARTAHERGASVVAVTGAGAPCPLLQWADVALGVVSGEPEVRSGAMASRLSQLLVVDVLFQTLVGRDYARNARLFVTNAIQKP